MDTLSITGLRSSGARIGDANVTEWEQLLQGCALKDLIWHTAGARSKSKHSTVTPAEVAEVMKVKAPIPAAPAAATTVAAPPRHEAQNRPTAASPRPPTPPGIYPGKEKSVSRYLAAIARLGIGRISQIGKEAGASAPRTSNWIGHHSDLVERVDSASARSGYRLTEKGRASAMALGIEVPPRNAKTTPGALPERTEPILERATVPHEQVPRPAPTPVPAIAAAPPAQQLEAHGCPFCGEPGRVVADGPYHLVWCINDNCMVRVEGPSLKTRTAAIAAWNRRAS
jgi:hypothetical protein